MEKGKELYLKNKGKKVMVDGNGGIVVGYEQKYMIAKFEKECGWALDNNIGNYSYIEESNFVNGCFYLYVNEDEIINHDPRKKMVNLQNVTHVELSGCEVTISFVGSENEIVESFDSDIDAEKFYLKLRKDGVFYEL